MPQDEIHPSVYYGRSPSVVNFSPPPPSLDSDSSTDEEEVEALASALLPTNWLPPLPVETDSEFMSSSSSPTSTTTTSVSTESVDIELAAAEVDLEQATTEELQENSILDDSDLEDGGLIGIEVPPLELPLPPPSLEGDVDEDGSGVGDLWRPYLTVSSLSSSPPLSSISEPTVEEICFIADAEEEQLRLVAHPQPDDEMEVRLVNMPRWKLGVSPVLDYQVVAYDEAYETLEGNMKVFYDDPKNKEKYKSSLRNIVALKMDFAVVKTPDGQYKRVRILHLAEDEEWETDSESDGWEDLPDDETAPSSGDTNSGIDLAAVQRSSDDNSVGFDVRILDTSTNVNIKLPHESLEWYLLQRNFCHLPYRTREFGLTDSEIFVHLFEFFDTCYDVLSQHDFLFKCCVNYLNENGVPFVTLKTPNSDKSGNSMIYIRIIKELPPPCVPPVHEVAEEVMIVHTEPNGEMFLHFQDMAIVDLFMTVSNEMTEQRYLEGKAKGLPPLDYDTHYLAPYDTTYYRCVIGGPISDGVDSVEVYFIDYGNHAVVEKSQLVRCSDVDELLDVFPKIAVRTHLANVGSVNWDLVFTNFKEKTHVLETLTPLTKTDLPYVDLMCPFQTDLRRFSEILLEMRYAIPWSAPRLDPPKTFPTIVAQNQFRAARIPMGEMNWGSSDDKVVKAEPGAILDVVLSALEGSRFLVKPVGASDKLRKLSKEIDNCESLAYIAQLTHEEYKTIRWSNMDLGSTLMYCAFPDLEILKRPRHQENSFSRVRVLNNKLDSGKILVLNVDLGYIFSTEESKLHPLPSQFLTLPAQSAQLVINNGKTEDWTGIPEVSYMSQRFLVQVEEVDKEAKPFGRCVITGKLFTKKQLHKKTGELVPGGVNDCQSLTAEEAKDVIVGSAIGRQYFPRLGNFNNGDTGKYKN